MFVHVYLHPRRNVIRLSKVRTNNHDMVATVEGRGGGRGEACKNLLASKNKTQAPDYKKQHSFKTDAVIGWLQAQY